MVEGFCRTPQSGVDHTHGIESMGGVKDVSNENTFIRLGNWIIELDAKNVGYTLGRVVHAGEEIKVQRLTLEMDAQQLVRLDIDGIRMIPTGDTE